MNLQQLQQIAQQPNAMQTLQAQMGNDPTYQRAMQMLNGKSQTEQMQVVQNLCSSMGVNYNELLQSFGVNNQ